MATRRQTLTGFLITWIFICSALALIQTVLLDRGNHRSWLLGVLLGACGGGIQGLTVLAVLNLIRVRVGRVQPRLSRALTLFAGAASTGILLPFAILLGMIAIAKLYYAVSGRTFAEFGGLALGFLVFTFGYLAATALLGGIVAGILFSRPMRDSAVERS